MQPQEQSRRMLDGTDYLGSLNGNVSRIRKRLGGIISEDRGGVIQRHVPGSAGLDYWLMNSADPD